MKTYFPLVGRILLAVMFVASGVSKVLQPSMTEGYMAANGVPLVGLFLVLAILTEVGGGLSLVLGLLTRWGAAVLVIFIIPTTLIFHTQFSDQHQMIHFMKNVSIVGGLLMILANGPGEWSLDHKLLKKEQ
jgi:putative oxidoreductase